MPLDESVAFYWTSLALSAAGVVVFLWLLRSPRPRKDSSGKSGSESQAGPKPPDRPTADR